MGKIMLDNIELTDDKHYQAPLPLKPEVKLDSNRVQVFHSFLSLLKKLKSNSKMSKDYIEFMNMMISNCFAERVPANEVNSDKAWYLTYYGVQHKQMHIFVLYLIVLCHIKESL